jgi:hypothetical protein
MDEYEWQKNAACITRMYYTERVWETTSFFCLCYSAVNYQFMRRNYIAATARARIMPAIAATLAFNTVISFILLKPLRYQEEMVPQIRKRLHMGKWLYSMEHLDDDIKYADFRPI